MRSGRSSELEAADGAGAAVAHLEVPRPALRRVGRGRCRCGLGGEGQAGGVVEQVARLVEARPAREGLRGLGVERRGGVAAMAPADLHAACPRRRTRRGSVQISGGSRLWSWSSRSSERLWPSLTSGAAGVHLGLFARRWRSRARAAALGRRRGGDSRRQGQGQREQEQGRRAAHRGSRSAVARFYGAAASLRPRARDSEPRAPRSSRPSGFASRGCRREPSLDRARARPRHHARA